MPYTEAYRAANKDKIRKYQRDWCRRNRESRRESCKKYHARNPKLRTLRKHGLSLSDFSYMLGLQMNLCAVCKVPMTHNGIEQDKCCIDHDHLTGRVRGLLCNGCNAGLGGFKDSKRSLVSAFKYLGVYA